MGHILKRNLVLTAQTRNLGKVVWMASKNKGRVTKTLIFNQ